MIPLRATRYIFGVTIMLFHFLAIGVFLWLGSQRLPLTEVLQGAGTVAPVAAIYLTTFVTYVASNPRLAPDEKNNPVSAGAFGVQYFIILLFSLALVSVPAFIFVTSAARHEDASLYTAFIDTVFAGYLGIIFKRLFPLNWSGA